MIEITEEDKQRLKDGESVEKCIKIREPVDGDVPSSINTIELKLSTKGVIPPNLAEPEELIEEFDDVDGVEEQLEEDGYL